MAINTKDLIAEVRKVAEADPEYVYYHNDTTQKQYGCSYNADSFGNRFGQPCLIGQALRNLGIIVEEEYETNTIHQLLSECVIDVVVLDPKDIRWLDLVQVAQDEGSTWGSAVASASDR